MVLSSKVVNEYFGRKRYDSKRAKLADPKKVRKAHKKPKLPTKHPAYHHQMVCELIGRRRRGFAFYLDMGAGKSKLSLDLFMYRVHNGEAQRMLVLVPKSQYLYEWQSQIEEHAPHLSVNVVDQTGSEARREAILEHSDVTLITYAGWNWLISTSSTKVTFTKGVLSVYELLFQFVVWDEASALGNNKSTFWRAAKRLADRGIFRYVLTGTPTNKDPEPHWPLIRLVDDGRTFGETKGVFQTMFFRKHKLPYSDYAYEWRFKKSKADDFARILRESSITYFAEEMYDMPKLRGGISDNKNGLLVHPVKAPLDVWRKYEEMERAMRQARGDREAVERSYNDIRRLTSGWMKYTDPEGRAQDIFFENNPKMEALLNILERCPDEKVIVFHYFNRTGDLIAEGLRKAKISCAQLYGANTAKVNKESYRKFLQEDVRVLVASSAGAYSLNPQKVCRRVVFYEPFDDARDRLQAERRVWRGKQERMCFIHDICMLGTKDEAIVQSTKEGKNLLDLLLKSPSK